MSSNKEMDNLEDNITENPETVVPVDIENQSPAGQSSTPVVQRVRIETLLRSVQVGLRITATVFSLLSFVIMASNNHSYSDYYGVIIASYKWDNYEAYRYLLAIGVVSFAYSLAQVSRQVLKLCLGKFLLPLLGLNILDFVGDQTMAYLLMSAASAAIPTTDELRQSNLYDIGTFTNASAASISMAFLAFVALALSAISSGFKLSTHKRI